MNLSRPVTRSLALHSQSQHGKINWMKVFSQASSNEPSSKENQIPTNPLEKIYTGAHQTSCGKIYDKRPFKVRLVPNKRYWWCLCGSSKSQPMCDGTHKDPYQKITFKPVIFEVTEEKDYWLCNCKQTKHRPFCDGTHKILK